MDCFFARFGVQWMYEIIKECGRVSMWWKGCADAMNNRLEQLVEYCHRTNMSYSDSPELILQ